MNLPGDVCDTVILFVQHRCMTDLISEGKGKEKGKRKKDWEEKCEMSRRDESPRKENPLSHEAPLISHSILGNRATSLTEYSTHLITYTIYFPMTFVAGLFDYCPLDS